MTPILTSLEILRLHQPDAYRWWIENTSLAEMGGSFHFIDSCCTVVDSLPSLNKSATDTMTIASFLDIIVSQKKSFSDAIYVMKHSTGDDQWEQLQTFPLTTAAIVFLTDLAQVGFVEWLDRTDTETRFNRLTKLSHECFYLLYNTAVANGIDMGKIEPDRLVTWAERLIDFGLAVDKGGGTIGPSPSIVNSINAENN